MEPTYYNGDLFFSTNYESGPIQVGDVVVFKVLYIFLETG